MELSALQIQELVDPSKTPTPEQIQIIESPTRPLLVVAGAGSGKTETMSMRVLWLVANHPEIEPDAVLGLTFTRKAAGELGDRLRERLRLLGPRLGWEQEDEAEPTSSTYNSFAERIVSEHGLRIGVDPDFTVLGQAAAVQMMTDIISTWKGDLHSDKSLATLVQAAIKLAGQIGEHRYSIEEARLALEHFGHELSIVGHGNGDARCARGANDTRISLLGPIEEFARRKRDAGYVDFSDQLVLAHRIVQEAPAVRELIRKEYKAVLLDEFQDTSVIQMELLAALFHDHPVTAVGDPNQAIYGWRGASASSLETFLERFQTEAEPEPEQTLTLSTAWRNDQQILVAANEIATPLREHSRRAKSPILNARPGADRGQVEVAYVENYQAQLKRVVDFVETHRVGIGKKRPSVAVLSRRRAPFKDIERALKERGIPTQVVGLGGLLDQPVIVDLRAVLQLSNDPRQSPSLMRLLANLDLGASDLVALADWAAYRARQEGNDPYTAILLDAVDSPPQPGWSAGQGRPALSQIGWERISLLGRRLAAIREGAGRGLTEQVERAMTIMGIVDDAIADPLTAGGRESLDAFVDVVVNYEAETPGASLSSFLTWLAAVEEEESGLDMATAEPDPDAVQIMTIHAAKGLEWDSVVVFGMSDGSFPKHSGKSVDWLEEPPGDVGWVNAISELPHPLRGDSKDLPPFAIELTEGRTPSAQFSNWLKDHYKPSMGAHLEREERRLAYVAMTRARHNQLLIGSWVNTAKTPRDPSRYLMEGRRALMRVLQADIDAENQAAASMDTSLAIGDAAMSPAATCGSPIDQPVGATSAQDELAQLQSAIVECPPRDEAEMLLPAEEPALFPQTPGPSRLRMAEAASSVCAELAQMTSDQDIFEMLAQIEDEPSVRDVTALLEERRTAHEKCVLTIWQDAIPATSVAALLEDPQQFASDLRRPMPVEPSAYSELGTIFHAWVERQLRRGAEEPPIDPLIDESALDEETRLRLDKLKDNFMSLDLSSLTPIALEEPFAVTVGGISVQGRIDAVFQEKSGRYVVVDWKSGRTPGAHTSAKQMRYYLTQLRLYKKAWAERMNIDPDEVDAKVVFMNEPNILNLKQVESMCGDYASQDLADLVTVAMN
ncbi:ATP-dependent helicase [Schaalia vaccimaxillae]|uniref:ATP-dependent helicase n=1 Tax=Schaalia vaccimaxillae TaxID=183916 RepID=UPI0003B7AE21|nr:ATP-dependent DNA helicase [Schaalia vaccimaxillae]